ncbi:MAG: HRDC domain-containing protein [Kiritimatiellae bacterium]|nr:HRDC domain-containing protein [Kiritimatiellia bacterium]
MSQFKTFLLPLEPDSSAEEELNIFLRGHRVVDVQRFCVPARGWCFCVEWLDGATGGGRAPGFAGRIDYMKELEPAVFAVFSKLRTRRKELAREAGVPPFGVATDAQLAEMAKMQEPTLAKIGGIEGFGDARVKAYGAKLLEVLEAGSAAPQTDDETRGQSL